MKAKIENSKDTLDAIPIFTNPSEEKNPVVRGIVIQLVNEEPETVICFQKLRGKTPSWEFATMTDKTLSDSINESKKSGDYEVEKIKQYTYAGSYGLQYRNFIYRVRDL
jgi:hypothetical protein